MKKRTVTPLAFTLFMLFSVSLQAQIPNGGFENWVADGDNTNPEGWFTTNGFPLVSVTPYTPAYAGNYSMKVSTFEALEMTFNGTAAVEFSYSGRPEALNACIKTTVMQGDRVLLILALFHGDSVVALPTDCTFSIDSTIAEFSCFSFPITYISSLVPDSATIIIFAGSDEPQAGTEIIVDELSFSLATPVAHRSSSNDYRTINYPNPARDHTYIPVELEFESDVEILIWDMKGALVHSTRYRSLDAGRHELLVNTVQLQGGIYLYAVRAEDTIFYHKMSISK